MLLESVSHDPWVIQTRDNYKQALLFVFFCVFPQLNHAHSSYASYSRNAKVLQKFCQATPDKLFKTNKL